ncbi:MAG: DUF711 family protein, partial [Bryobacteraceae bacterium]
MNHRTARYRVSAAPATIVAIVVALFCVSLGIFVAAPAAYPGAAPVYQEPIPQKPVHQKPLIRAITVFVQVMPESIAGDVQSAVDMLQKSKAQFEKAGYQVQTLRITTQPFEVLWRRLPEKQLLAFYDDYAARLQKAGVISSIGQALRTAVDNGERDLFAKVLAAHPSEFNGSIPVSDDNGLRWPAIRAAAHVMKYLEANSPHGQGNFNFAAEADVHGYSPFFPASFFTAPDHRFAIALQGASLVDEAFSSVHGDFTKADAALRNSLYGEVREIQSVAAQIAKNSGWTYMGLDDSTAPLIDVSIGAAIEKLTGVPVGSPGTMTAAQIITRVLKDAPGQHAGYSGLMLPVLEDARLARRWSEGRLSIDSLLAYSAVCGTGLDTVPLPGEVTEQQLASIIADVASLAIKWKKPLTARLFPVPGKKA